MVQGKSARVFTLLRMAAVALASGHPRQHRRTSVFVSATPSGGVAFEPVTICARSAAVPDGASWFVEMRLDRHSFGDGAVQDSSFRIDAGAMEELGKSAARLALPEPEDNHPWTMKGWPYENLIYDGLSRPPVAIDDLEMDLSGMAEGTSADVELGGPIPGVVNDAMQAGTQWTSYRTHPCVTHGWEDGEWTYGCCTFNTALCNDNCYTEAITEEAAPSGGRRMSPTGSATAATTTATTGSTTASTTTGSSSDDSSLGSRLRSRSALGGAVGFRSGSFDDVPTQASEGAVASSEQPVCTRCFPSFQTPSPDPDQLTLTS
jgi:hypothetical protein